MYSIHSVEHKHIMKFFKTSWTNMNVRCGKYKTYTLKNKIYNHINILFSRTEFKQWCFTDENILKILSLKKPSIDRIDTNGDYSIDNIQIIELVDNIKKKKATNHWEYATKKRGVSFKNNRYIARITHKQKEIYLGCFTTKEDAYQAYYNEFVKLYNRSPW